MVREMRDIYAQLQEIFAEGIYEGGKNHVKMGVNENTTGEGGVRYSFAGKGANSANLTALEKAKKLAEDGIVRTAYKEFTSKYDNSGQPHTERGGEHGRNDRT